MSSSRFLCPSASLSLNGLLRCTYRGLWIGCISALGIHLLVAQWERSGQEQKAFKPLTTKFVKRAPRLTKPLEMKKQPRPKRRMMRREMVTVKAKVERQEATSALRPVRMVQQLARPRVQIGRITSFQATSLEPQVIAQVVESTKEAKTTVDMSLEMMDIEALDTGQYHAMVIQDPTDKRNLKGFFHLAVAYPMSALEWDYQGKEMARTNGALRRLIDKMNEWTSIQCDVKGRYTFESREFFKIPWVYLQIRFNIFPTYQEKANLGRYMLSGGLYFADGPNLSKSSEREAMGYHSQKRFIVDALASQDIAVGKDCDWERLSNSHQIFHIYFDFDGAPQGYLMSSTHIWGWTALDSGVPDLYGIELDDRLLCILTNQNYNDAWAMWGIQSGPNYVAQLAAWDPTRQLQFGINSIIFALLQEGSITNRLMNVVQ